MKRILSILLVATLFLLTSCQDKGKNGLSSEARQKISKKSLTSIEGIKQAVEDDIAETSQRIKEYFSSEKRSHIKTSQDFLKNKENFYASFDYYLKEETDLLIRLREYYLELGKLVVKQNDEATLQALTDLQERITIKFVKEDDKNMLNYFKENLKHYQNIVFDSINNGINKEEMQEAENKITELNKKLKDQRFGINYFMYDISSLERGIKSGLKKKNDKRIDASFKKMEESIAKAKDTRS